MMKKLLFACLFGLLLIPAQAQWKTRFSLGSSFYTGNVDKFDFRTSGSVSRADSLLEYATSFDAIYSETNNTKDNQVLKGNLKVDYLPHSTFSPFAAASAYNNTPKQIELRLSGMVGGKYTFINQLDEHGKEVSDYSISAAIQYDRERYTGDTPGTEKARLSIRPKFEQKIGDNVTFEHVTFYVPKITDFADFIIDSKTALTSKLTSKIQLELSYQLEHLSRLPSDDLENTDQAVLASIVVKL